MTSGQRWPPGRLELSSADTITPGRIGSAGEDGVGRRLGPYELLERLGSGGAGTVYRANDTALGRMVALKLLRGDEPDLVERFFREAKGQARVQHENVCPVYAAGVIDGQAYIAMQHIPGEPLYRLTPRLTLEQKLMLMVEVAEGVQAAHAEGLVHRDLKPGNILVSVREDGRLKPWVVDFGLVRDESAPGTTATGQMLGTPAYMAPEQVRGEIHRIDRRTDVYGLGAVLYELLCGRAPFETGYALAELVRVLDEDPIPPRKLHPEIPLDLEIITLACLDKAPQRRYQSARAFADDLRRYLAGEPILAHRTSIARRVVRRLHRHRALVIPLAVASVIAISAAVVALQARWRAGQQARFARTFGQDARDMEWLMRVAHMSPLHDLSLEREQVRKRMREVTDEAAAAGRVARAPANLALGRGYLVLGEYANARERLEGAWSGGFRDPDVAHALGLALGELYRRELEALRGITDAERRAARAREVAAEYRQPVLAALRLSRRSRVAVPEYFEGLIALFEGRVDDGLRAAELAIGRQPWFYEARILEADLVSTRARRLRDEGKYRDALADLERAATAVERALVIGRSDARGFEALCGIWVESTIVRQQQSGEEAVDAVEKAMAACSQALIAEPARATAMVQQSIAQRLLGSARQQRGQDARAAFAAADALAARALAVAPSLGLAHEALGSVRVEQARAAFSAGRDPRPLLESAIASLRAVASAGTPRASSYDWIGSAWRLRAWFEWARGLDPLPSWEQALHAYSQAVTLEGASPSYRNDNADVFATRASYKVAHGLDPDADLGLAVKAYQGCLAINPNLADTYAGLGTAHFTRVEDALQRDIDPAPFVADALTVLERATALGPRSDYAFFALGYVSLLESEYAIRHGRHNEAALERARANLERAVALNPGNAFAHTQLANLARLRAQTASNGAARRAALAAGGRAVNEALGRDATLSDAHLAAGRLEIEAARTPGASAAAVERSLRQAGAALERARASNPSDARIHCALAERAEVETRWQRARGRDVTATIARGLTSAARARELNPRLRAAVELEATLRRL